MNHISLWLMNCNTIAVSDCCFSFSIIYPTEIILQKIVIMNKNLSLQITILINNLYYKK